jgi:hypothetical protein
MQGRFQGACFAFGVGLLVIGCGSNRVTSSAASGSASPAAAASAANQPVLGYAWDSSHSGLRAMLGVPGAASLSNNVVRQGSFTSATFCQRKNFALLRNSTGSIYAVSLPGGDPVLLTAQVGASEQIAVSPSCSKALIYQPGGSSGVVMSGLPSAPQMETLSFSTSGSIAAAAVGDMGDAALAVVRSDGSTVLQLLLSSGSMSSPLLNLQNYGAMTFVPGGDTILVADAGANQLWMVTPSLPAKQLASANDGISLPLAIASSADGRMAFVANRNGIPLLRVDLVTNTAPARVACACRPSELIPLAGNAIFQISELSSGTIYALDASQAIPKTLFIPAGRSVNVTAAWQ